MAKKKDSPYSVGYGKPPEHSRFTRGKSGNPRGRPRKKRTFEDDFQAEMNSTIAVNVGGQVKRITKSRAIAKQITNKAAEAIKPFVDLAAKIAQRARPVEEDNLAPVLDAFERRYGQLGSTGEPGEPSTNRADDKNSSDDGGSGS